MLKISYKHLEAFISTVGILLQPDDFRSAGLWVRGVTENRFCKNGTNMTIPNSTTPAAKCSPGLYQLDEKPVRKCGLAAAVESVEQTGQGQGGERHGAGYRCTAGSKAQDGRRSWY